MAGKLTIGDSHDVLTVLRWLGVDQADHGTTATDTEAARALVRLGGRAGRAMQITQDPERITVAVLLAGEHRRAGGAW